MHRGGEKATPTGISQIKNPDTTPMPDTQFDPPTNVNEDQPIIISADLILNGGFETGTSAPTGWSTDAWTPSYSVFTWDSTQKHSGNKSVKIASNTANDARWIQTLTVLPNSDYRLSGWIKTENVAHSQEARDAGANFIPLWNLFIYRRFIWYEWLDLCDVTLQLWKQLTNHGGGSPWILVWHNHRDSMV